LLAGELLDLRKPPTALFVFNNLMTVGALAIGSAVAWRDAEVRPAAAIAAAMRNPGLALVIATANRAPPAVTAAVIGYALGLAVTIIGYVQWHKRRN